MKVALNIAENGNGSYRLLAILRWVMVIIFVSFGIQKFTLQSAQGIVQFISNSPFISWISVFGLRGEAYFLGVVELGIAALLAAGAFSPLLSALGSLMGVITFFITWSFFFTTPGVVKWSLSADPIAWNLTGEFIFKDIVLLCVCVVLLLASLPDRGRTVKSCLTGIQLSAVSDTHSPGNPCLLAAVVQTIAATAIPPHLGCRGTGISSCAIGDRQ